MDSGTYPVASNSVVVRYVVTIKYQQISVLSYENGKANYRATEMESGSGCMVSNLRPAPVRLVIGGGIDIDNVEIIDALQAFMDELNELAVASREDELATGEAA
jgi:hypothetical protein